MTAALSIRPLILCLLAGLVSQFAYGAPPREKTTNRLWGIAEVRVNTDKSVTLVDAIEGNGHAMMFSLAKHVDSVTLKAGDSCQLTDGDHATIRFTLKAVNGDKLIVSIKETFDARSFGDGINVTEKTVVISPYKTTLKKQK